MRPAVLVVEILTVLIPLSNSYVMCMSTSTKFSLYYRYTTILSMTLGLMVLSGILFYKMKNLLQYNKHWKEKVRWYSYLEFWVQMLLLSRLAMILVSKTTKNGTIFSIVFGSTMVLTELLPMLIISKRIVDKIKPDSPSINPDDHLAIID